MNHYFIFEYINHNFYCVFEEIVGYNNALFKYNILKKLFPNKKFCIFQMKGGVFNGRYY